MGTAVAAGQELLSYLGVLPRPPGPRSLNHRHLMSLIYEPPIFRQFPRLRAAQTLRGTTHPPYGFNMSLSVGDDPERVTRNRARLAERLGFRPENLLTQRQVHGDRCVTAGPGYEASESDAMITTEPGLLLAASTADCIPLLIHDPRRGAVAAVHSGWRGSRLNIAGLTVERMISELGTDPADLVCHIGASAGQCCYEVGEEVAGCFAPRHSREHRNGKYLFDNRGVVLDQLLARGVQAGGIAIDPRCTICDPNFHSYRRDGRMSGRMFGVIGLREVETSPEAA